MMSSMTSMTVMTQRVNGDLFSRECRPKSFCEEVVGDVNSGVDLTEELCDEVSR